MQTKQVQQQFATRAATYNASANWITNEKLIEAHLNLAGPTKGKGIELCCGTGVNGKALSEKGWDMTGVDITWEMLEFAKQHMKVVHSSVEQLPFENGHFDLAVLRQAMFLFDTPVGLKEIRRVLKKGSPFIVSQTVPFSEADESWLKEIHCYKQAQLLKFYNTLDIEKLIIHSGFNIAEKITLSVRESINRWMEFAPELTPEKKKGVCDMVANAPEAYKKIRNVEVVNGEILEDWQWVVFKCI